MDKLIRYRLQNIDELDVSPNYFLQTFKSDKLLNTLLLILCFLIIIVEFFYREPLFEYSLDFESNFQKSGSQFITFFKIITKIGGEYLMALPLLIIIIFFSIVKTVVYLTGFIFWLSIHSAMKIWYGNIRPFWKNSELYKGICDGGFGNPSGHSMLTTYLYLALFAIVRDTVYVSKRFVVQSILLIIAFIWTILIIISRLILGVHSINQVIYGSTFGLGLVLIMYKVFRMHKMPVYFFKRLFNKKSYFIIILFTLLLITFLAVISSFFCNQDINYDEYKKVLNENCENLPEFRKFNNDGLFGSLIILGLIGIFLGQKFFWYLIKFHYKKNNCTGQEMENEKEPKKDERVDSLISVNVKSSENWTNSDGDTKEDLIVSELVNHWNDNRIFACSSCTNILKIIFVVLLCLSPVVIFILVPKDIDLRILFIFKISLPYFLVLFFMFGPGFYYIIKITCGSKDIILKQIYLDEKILKENQSIGINSKDINE